MHLADALNQSDTVYSGSTFFVSMFVCYIYSVLKKKLLSIFFVSIPTIYVPVWLSGRALRQ